MSKRRVVITGLGMVTPLGNTVEQTWAAIQAGESGIRPIEEFDTEGFTTTFAGTVKDLDLDAVIEKRDRKKMDVFIHYGLAAAAEALSDSGLTVTDEVSHRYGVCLGSGIGGLHTMEDNILTLKEKGPRRVSPFFIPATIINLFPGHVSMRYNLRGPNLGVVTACTTGTHAIGLGARTIAYGDADVMVVGGAEKASTPVGVAGFCSARALSTRNDDPKGASRPWSADRDGFVLGDGAGVLVIESLEHAQARGAKIYAEVIGFGMSSDAYHITAPSEGGEGAARSMQAALDDAQVAPEEIDYINAHGTSTPAGDIAETDAVKSAFGEHAYKVAMSSTKSMTGHLLGAAGAVEAIITTLAIRDGIAPPTINLDNPGEGCDLDYVPNTARKMPINIALSNSFGFGGTNGTVIFRSFD